jgi:hypothetical protein
MTAFFGSGASNSMRAALDAIKALPNSGHLLITNQSAATSDPNSTIPSGAAVLADFTFSAAAFGADATTGTWGGLNVVETAIASFSASTVTALQTGTAASAWITNAGKTVCYFTCSVGTSATDIIFNSVAFSSGANITLSSFTLVMPQ